VAGDKIIQKIEEEARQDAAAIGAQAQEKAQKEREQILAKAKAEVAAIEAKAKVDAKEAAGRLNLIAELQSRKAALASKREVLQEAFAEAAKKLADLDKEQWEKLILHQILSADLTGHEQLVVPAKDRAAYKDGFLKKINKKLQQQGKDGKLSLADEAAEFDDGLLIIGDTCDYDGSFTTLLDDVRTEEEYRVAEILFGAEVK